MTLAYSGISGDDINSSDRFVHSLCITNILQAAIRWAIDYLIKCATATPVYVMWALKTKMWTTSAGRDQRTWTPFEPSTPSPEVNQGGYRLRIRRLSCFAHMTFALGMIQCQVTGPRSIVAFQAMPSIAVIGLYIAYALPIFFRWPIDYLIKCATTTPVYFMWALETKMWTTSAGRDQRTWTPFDPSTPSPEVNQGLMLLLKQQLL
ncbi:hypothetical protein L1987_61268 [Smallanthus sonchifolius]|uniref:Uncharacterized protein n=1 Tax=Smallanthus sonchifolius TaxID=185202 RepID=A0ACB9DA87_9ASTR|nr:hypothetical protein L1987_61268 [Smallanthus sonchifolius]